MYKAINLHVDKNISKNSEGIDDEIENKFPPITDLFSNGKYSVDQIVEDHFSTKNKYKVFISHSHADKKIALLFKASLEECGVTCFVDSMYWNYVNEVLKELDEDHCALHSNPDGSITFNYEKRNKMTAIVHTILTTQLSKAMDRSDCVVFINTENSLNNIDDISCKFSTYSPWLAHEISMTGLLRRKRPLYLKRELIDESMEAYASAKRQHGDDFPVFEFNVAKEIKNMPVILGSEFLKLFLEGRKLGFTPDVNMIWLFEEIKRAEKNSTLQRKNDNTLIRFQITEESVSVTLPPHGPHRDPLRP